MKRYMKILLLGFGMILLTACKPTPVEVEKVIDFIQVDQDTVNESYDIGFFSIDNIEIFVYYTDMTYEKVRLDNTSVSTHELGLLDTAGEYNLQVVYQGETAEFTVKVVNNGLFEVSFDSNGGSEVEPAMVYFGHEVDEPVEPTLEGHVFEGWYLGDNKWNFEGRHITEDLELTAKWTINTYVVAIYEETDSLITALSGEHGDLIHYNVAPTRNGYTFDGWAIYDGISMEDFSFPFVVESDATIYAKWIENPLRIFNWNIGSDPRTLDPGLNGAMVAGDVIHNTFEGLVREKEGVVHPGMAESWETSNDGLTVTFHIRDDAKWSDGTAVTADDFVRSWLRAMDPRNASETSWIWESTNIVGVSEFVNSTTDYPTVLDAQRDAVGIESQDEGATFIIHLTQPTDYLVSLLSYFAFSPVPEDATILGEGAWAKNPSTAISNGPFTLVEYNVGEGLVLVRNEEYWNADHVNIDVINGYFIEEETQAYVMYYNDELDFLPTVPQAEVNRLLITSNEFHVFPFLGTYYINFNLSGCEVGGTRDIGTRDNTIFCNENLRKALSLSIDRNEITEVLEAAQVPAGGLIPPGFPDFSGDDFYHISSIYSEIEVDDGAYALALDYFELAAVQLYPFAPTTEKAVLLLQGELETKSYHHNTSEGHQQVAELIQGMWEENLGFTIAVTNEELELYSATRNDGNYDLSVGGWLSDYMDPQSMLDIFRQGNYYNYADYNSVAFEEKMVEADTAISSLDHYIALYEAYAIFMDDMPVIPIYHYSDYYLINGRLTGWTRSALGSIDFSTASVVTAP